MHTNLKLKIKPTLCFSLPNLKFPFYCNIIPLSLSLSLSHSYILSLSLSLVFLNRPGPELNLCRVV
jgi:hypothetical protein